MTVSITVVGLYLCRALSAMDTLRSFKRCGAKGVYRHVLSGNHMTKSAVLFKIVNTNYEAHKKVSILPE